MLSKTPNIDDSEIDKFAALADEWWAPEGELRTLHHINPTRLRYIDDIARIEGKEVLDIGCGGGILSEAMARKGAKVTAIDASASAIEVARRHLEESELPINYHATTAEDFALIKPGNFDVIGCLELLEHVPDVGSLLHACSSLLKPEGHLFLSTINRNLIAYSSVILAAEYVFNLLPKGTHDYAKFIKPSELAGQLRSSGFEIMDISGMSYIPGIHRCSLNKNPSINYLVHAVLRN